MSEDNPQEAGRLLDGEAGLDDRELDRALRPVGFSEFIGQRKMMDNLQVYVQAARKRGEPLDHVLLCGPPGLGKTTVANILGNEMGRQVLTAHGPAVEHKGQLAALLTRMERGDVLFIDEIHRLSAVVEENLYTAVEDFRIDIVQGDGPYAASIQLPLAPFTLIGATTRTGLLTNPMLSRFGIVERLDYYPPEDLAEVVSRSARLLRIQLDEDAALEIARRARGTPRIANRLLRRARDFATVLGDGDIDRKLADAALTRLDVDGAGLDAMDRRLLKTIIEHYNGGPVGIDTLAAALSEPRDTLEDVYEPYLLQQGFLARTARGRVVTDRGYEHLGVPTPPRSQQRLF
ncbi:MAG: Holliday junction branch migration DNA helicase RuvB [Myxococcales bacterium]|nr:Holliday junction branch migration DNA helicase RuvB [Myxococcales bacterium]